MPPKIMFPYKFCELLPGHDKTVKDGVYAAYGGLIRVGPEGLLLPASFAEIAEDVYNFVPRKDDVWVATYPRSGTTVTQELVWMVANDMDYEGAKVPLTERFPFLELEQFTVNVKDAPQLNVIPKLENMKSRRYIKSHLTYSLLHPNLLTNGSKVIYVARNPKDVIVSYYHFHHLIGQFMNFSGDFPTFFEYFLNDSLLNNPYWEHVLQGWENRHRPNYLFLFYEDFRKQPEDTIRKVASFLEKSPTDDQIDKLKEHLDINNFKKNPAVNAPTDPSILNQEESFIRKGEVRNWEKYFTREMSEAIDRIIREKFDPVGLKFDC